MPKTNGSAKRGGGRGNKRGGSLAGGGSCDSPHAPGSGLNKGCTNHVVVVVCGKGKKEGKRKKGEGPKANGKGERGGCWVESCEEKLERGN